MSFAQLHFVRRAPSVASLSPPSAFPAPHLTRPPRPPPQTVPGSQVTLNIRRLDGHGYYFFEKIVQGRGTGAAAQSPRRTRFLCFLTRSRSRVPAPRTRESGAGKESPGDAGRVEAEPQAGAEVAGTRQQRSGGDDSSGIAIEAEVLYQVESDEVSGSDPDGSSSYSEATHKSESDVLRRAIHEAFSRNLLLPSSDVSRCLVQFELQYWILERSASSSSYCLLSDIINCTSYVFAAEGVPMREFVTAAEEQSIGTSAFVALGNKSGSIVQLRRIGSRRLQLRVDDEDDKMQIGADSASSESSEVDDEFLDEAILRAAIRKCKGVYQVVKELLVRLVPQSSTE